MFASSDSSKSERELLDLLATISFEKDSRTTTSGDPIDVCDLLEDLFAVQGSEDLGDLLADEVHAGRLTVLQVTEALNYGRWIGHTNGADLSPTLDRWMGEGRDLIRIQIVLGQEIYPLGGNEEMEVLLPQLAQRWPEVAEQCHQFLASRKEQRPAKSLNFWQKNRANVQNQALKLSRQAPPPLS